MQVVWHFDAVVDKALPERRAVNSVKLKAKCCSIEKCHQYIRFEIMVYETFAIGLIHF